MSLGYNRELGNDSEKEGYESTLLVKEQTAALSQHTFKSYINARLCLGIIGVIFPFIFILASLFNPNISFLHSISAYHHTTLRTLFQGPLFAISVFLISYSIPNGKVYFNSEKWLYRIAGICAILIASFPTNNLDTKIISQEWMPTYGDYLMFYTWCLPPNWWINFTHQASALAFFSIISYLVYFKFKNDDHHAIHEKEKNVEFYKYLGAIIMICVIILIIYHCFPEEYKFKRFPFVLMIEAIALFVFGLSWLKKSAIMNIRLKTIRDDLKSKMEKDAK